MGVLFLIVFFFVSFLIVGLVLLQEGKGGGLTGMSTGMDGVMGAKNPLRRMTAYLFVFFVLLAITINWYFHQRSDTAIPAGVELPTVEMEQQGPFTGPLVLDGEPLRPGTEPEQAPAMPLRPEPAQPGETNADAEPAGSLAPPPTAAAEPAIEQSDAPADATESAPAAPPAAETEPAAEAQASPLAPPASETPARSAEQPVSLAPPPGEAATEPVMPTQSVTPPPASASATGDESVSVAPPAESRESAPAEKAD